MANVWRNATDCELQRWQPAESTDNGRRARCSLAHYRRFPLERHQSRMGLQWHVVGRLVVLPAEELGRSLAPGRDGLPGLPHHKNPARSGFGEGWSNYPPSPMAVPIHHRILIDAPFQSSAELPSTREGSPTGWLCRRIFESQKKHIRASTGRSGRFPRDAITCPGRAREPGAGGRPGSQCRNGWRRAGSRAGRGRGAHHSSRRPSTPRRGD